MSGFKELSNEQRRQLIDVEQVFTAWRDDRNRFEHGYRAIMKWGKRPNGEYLLRTDGVSNRSLGPRSPETERIKADYDAARKALKTGQKKAWARLEEMARVNKALRLARVPRIAARILREVDDAGLLGTALHVVGTNSLFAYEMKAGVIINSDMVATGDADFLFDARRSLHLTGDVKAEGVIGLLRKVDKSFRALGPRSFRAKNDDGYFVDLITPMVDARIQRREKIGEANYDLYSVEIYGLEWLINAPKIAEVAIGEDGLPLYISCVDPRVYAAHKLWVSQQPDRSAVHRPRDAAQARLVAELCRDYLALRFDAPELSAMPKALRNAI